MFKYSQFITIDVESLLTHLQHRCYYLEGRKDAGLRTNYKDYTNIGISTSIQKSGIPMYLLLMNMTHLYVILK